MIGHEQDEACVPQPARENDALAAAKQKLVQELLREPDTNIVGVGIGKKVRGRKTTSEDCVRVYVVKKEQDKDKLARKSIVRCDIDGIATDVIEIERFGRRGRLPQTTLEPNSTARAGARVRVRTNAPNINEGARGTVAAVLNDDCGNHYILGCNHLLAVNGRVPPNADLVLAEFVGFEKTIVAKMTYTYVKLNCGSNFADCAMVQLPDGANVPNIFPDNKEQLTSPDPITPKVDMDVTKYGAITRRTYGKIVDTQMDLFVNYSFGTFRFENQILIEDRDNPDFATLGDSGSLVVDMDTHQATAMIFAASGQFAVACPLERVLTSLGQEINARLELLV